MCLSLSLYACVLCCFTSPIHRFLLKTEHSVIPLPHRRPPTPNISIIQHIAGDTNAHEMWHKLSALYERKNALNKTSFMRKIVRLKYRDGESIVVHNNTFMGLVNRLASAKFPLDDVVQALLLLCTPPDSWENLSLHMVKTSILNKETRRDKGVLPQSEANVAQHSGRERSKQRSPQGRDKSHARSRGKLIFFYCGKPGHFQKDCQHLKRNRGVSNNVEPRKRRQEELLFICEQVRANLANEECTWVIDSGASFHITPSKEYFQLTQPVTMAV